MKGIVVPKEEILSLETTC